MTAYLLELVPPTRMRPLSLALLRTSWAAAPLALLLAAGCRTIPPMAPPPAEPPLAPPPSPVQPPPEEPEPEAEIDKDDAFRPVPEGVFESQSYYPAAEVTEWRLASGARLVFRPMPGDRRLRLYAFAPGGFAAVPDSLGTPAFTAPGLDGEEDAEVYAGVAAREAVLWGAAPTEALGTLFSRVRTALAAPAEGARSSLAVEEALDAALAGLRPTAVLSERAAGPVYERLFGDPRRFTFVLVGDATTERVEQEAARVLPRIRPSFQSLVAPGDSGVVPARVPRREERWTIAGAGPPAVAVAFRGRIEPSYDALAALDVLAALLAEEIGEDVRPSAVVHFDAGVGEVRIVAEDVEGDLFEEAVLDAVRELRAAPPSEREMAAVRGRLRSAHARSLEAPDGWLRWLARLYRYDHDTREAVRYGRRLGGVTPERIHRAARAVLDPERFVFVHRPGG